MSDWQSPHGDLGEQQLASLRQVLARWHEHRSEEAPRQGEGVVLVDVELLHAGRPGVLDVIAEMDGLLTHAVLGLHRLDDELHVHGPVDEVTLGVIEDRDGPAVVVDALHDADAARLLLGAVAGDAVVEPGRVRPGVQASPAAFTVLRDDSDTTVLGFDHRATLTVFPWLHRGPHPGVTLLAGLDDARFNHLAAPIAFWRRAGRDLGVVQELVAGAAGGWVLALTSLRDLFASGTSPDVAGGDFAPEAFALGTMTARMHIALDQAFGRQTGDVAAWSDEIGTAIALEAPAMLDEPAPGRSDVTLRQTIAAVRETGIRSPTIRTHGDFHLGRTARSDHGWVLADCMPGGADPVTGAAVFRSPLADVADMCRSIHHAAVAAATERGPATAHLKVGGLAEAWNARNRQAFLAAYLATPGIGGLVPADRRVVRRMVTIFEAARAARGAPSLGPSATAPPN